VATAFYAVERCGGVRGGGHVEFIACRAWSLTVVEQRASGLAGRREQCEAKERAHILLPFMVFKARRRQ